MEEKKRNFSLGKKMYIFVIVTVLAVAFGTSAIAFTTGANQIDRYYKQNTADKAAYIKEMDELNRQMQESDLEFALVMVDINNLKYINDEYGHRAGDQYIKGCCHMVCEMFKRSPVYRIGGDEFVAVLMGQDYTNRKKALDQLKTDFIKTYEQTDVSPWLRYSAAIGMAESASDDYTTELIFKRADKAMYKDKAQFKQKYGIDIR